LKVRERRRFHCLQDDGVLLDLSHLECSSSTSPVVAS
jgi:hypothetical protein